MLQRSAEGGLAMVLVVDIRLWLGETGLVEQFHGTRPGAAQVIAQAA